MNPTTSEILTLLLVALTGIAAFSLGHYFQQADEERTLACLTAASCPGCGQTYGGDLPETLARVHYTWIPSAGNTIGGLGLPHATFLTTCPHCAAQIEYRDNAQIFVHPQNGILDFTRQVRFRLPSPVNRSPAGTAIRKTLDPIF
jgi:hypothetical protein